MADSITSCGTIPFFPLEPNWAVTPEATIRMARKMFVYPGTGHTMEELTEDAPIVVELGFTPFTLEDRYNLLDFFATRKGRHEKFWIEWPKSQFSLNRDHDNGEATLDCYTNLSDLQLQLYERIQILMPNGDKIIRKIISASGDGEVNLGLDTSLDRDVDADGYVRISRLLLVRFDSDNFDWKSVTDVHGNVTLSFAELVNEYSEV